mgnify:CR=1 FL=1
MRLCRFEHDSKIQVGFYDEDFVIPLAAASDHTGIALEESSDLIAHLGHFARRLRRFRLDLSTIWMKSWASFGLIRKLSNF